MYKVGIITTSHAINYGAVLQAFSLKKAIEENTNTKVNIINYCGSEEIAGRIIFRKVTSFKDIAANIISLFNTYYRKNRIALYHIFDEFKLNYLEIKDSLITTEHELEGLYDYNMFVCGSDQVWNINLFDDPVYFLSFVEYDIPKVAYAVSLSDHMTDEQMSIIANRIKNFKAISIREYDDAQRLSQIMQYKIDNVIDPVFLHDADEWRRLLSIPPHSQRYTKPYIFVFLISHQKNDQEIINKIKDKQKIVVLNLHPIRYVTGDIELNVCSPNEFVDIISNADAIITDSFHCTAFSIIFNKVFYNIKRSARNNRIENLYNKFTIKSRFADITKIPPHIIEYKTANIAIEKEANIGKQFIMNNIGE